MTTPRSLTQSQVKTAIRRVRRELAAAGRALFAGDSVACRNALERAQHRSYEAKALFQGEELPAEEELAA